MRRAGAVAATVCLAGAVTGCGERKEPVGPTPPPYPRSRYVERVNAACAQLARRTRTLAERSLGAGPPSRGEARAYERRAMALQRGELTRLRALPRPPGDAGRISAIYDAWEAALRDLARLPPDRPGGRVPASVERFRRLAGAYGLRACAGVS